MTEKLYYIDSHMHRFTAVCTACRDTGGRYAVTLDRTAFFPEGGGQLADTGSIGQVRVLDVHERGGEVWHYTAAPLEPGREYECALDYEQRLRRMQNHSGEHVVSGHIHALYGADNVGFHMGTEFMTIDLSRELTWDELMEVEHRANETVRADLPVKTWFPAPAELAALEYRSKLDLTENVRIVEIPGVDRCACCAPHVAHTGEIGFIKLLDCVRHRGGVRVSLVCGMDALDAVRVMQKNVTDVSRLTSARREDPAFSTRSSSSRSASPPSAWPTPVCAPPPSPRAGGTSASLTTFLTISPCVSSSISSAKNARATPRPSPAAMKRATDTSSAAARSTCARWRAI